MPAAIFARLKNALLVLLVLWVSTTLATAASPSLGAIRPVGAQRGTEIEVTLSGARLGDAKEIFYYQPGITTVSLARVDDNTVKAKLKIAAAGAATANLANPKKNLDQASAAKAAAEKTLAEKRAPIDAALARAQALKIELDAISAESKRASAKGGLATASSAPAQTTR